MAGENRVSGSRKSTQKAPSLLQGIQRMAEQLQSSIEELQNIVEQLQGDSPRREPAPENTGAGASGGAEVQAGAEGPEGSDTGTALTVGADVPEQGGPNGSGNENEIPPIVAEQLRNIVEQLQQSVQGGQSGGGSPPTNPS